MSAPFSSVVCLAVMLQSAVVGAQTLRVQRAEVLSVDMVLDPQPVAAHPAATGPAGVVWTQPVRARFPQGGGLDAIRVLVAFDGPWPANHVLRFLNASGAEIESVRGGSALREYWSREIPDTTATVSLTREAAGPTPGARITYAYRIIPTEKQSLTPPNQLMLASSAPPRLRALAKPVARLRFMIDGEGQATCTAFVVGPRLMLTNQHCITNDSERASALVDFDYDSEDSALTAFRVQEVVASSPELDYALLRLASDPPATAGRLYFAPKTWQWAAAPTLNPLLIVQHPSGWPKHVSIADCRMDGPSRAGVRPGDATDFGHLCDTLGGSSGSPVMDWTTGQVVGLHHFGFLAGAKEPVNQAVQFARILDDIASKNAQAHAEVIRPKP